MIKDITFTDSSELPNPKDLMIFTKQVNSKFNKRYGKVNILVTGYTSNRRSGTEMITVKFFFNVYDYKTKETTKYVWKNYRHIGFAVGNQDIYKKF